VSFFGSAGRIRATDETGGLRLDTDDGLFHPVGPIIAGYVNIAQLLLNNGQTVNDELTWDLGSCHSACTHVIGAVRFSGSVGGAIGFDRWTTYLGGDLIWILDSPPKLANGSYGTSPSDLLTYRFYVSGAHVWLKQRRIVLGGPTNNLAGYRAHTVQWKLKTGLFS